MRERTEKEKCVFSSAVFAAMLFTSLRRALLSMFFREGRSFRPPPRTEGKAKNIGVRLCALETTMCVGVCAPQFFSGFDMAASGRLSNLKKRMRPYSP